MMEYYGFVSLSFKSDLRLTVVSTQAQFSVSAQLESEEHTNTQTQDGGHTGTGVGFTVQSVLC